MEIGKRIKTLRENNKLSQQELADNIKINKTTLNYWERGEKIPRIKNIIKIAVYFNVSMDCLLGITKAP